MAALSQTPTYPPAGGGGGGGSVTSVAATGTALVNATVVNPTTTPTVVLTLPNQPANSVVGNFTGSPAAPVASATPAFSAVNLNSFPTGQFAQSALVSPITSGLVGEYHLNEASGATVAIDYSGQGNNGAYFGTPTLPGTLSGGMTSAGAGGMDYPTAFNTGASEATTLSTYVCSNALTATSASYALLIGGLNSATAPSTSDLRSFGLMMNQNNLATLPGFTGKYGTNPSVFNGATVPTVSSQAVDGCHLITWIRGSSTDKLFIDANEVTPYQFQTAGTLALTPASGSISLGMPHFATLPNAAFAYPFSIYFNFVYNRALTAAEVSTLSGSAQTYAQFRGIVKAPTTFSDAGNQLLFVGDSITFGINGTPWVRSIATTTPYIAITGVAGLTNNIATPSWQLSNMIQECESRGYGAMNPNSATTVVIWGGTNSLALATGTGQISAATTYQELRRLVQCYKRRAPRVIVTTMISRVGNGFGGTSLDTLKNGLNDLIRKDYAGADGMWDIASYTNFGADGAATTGNTFAPTGCGGSGCFGVDGVHPSAGGETVVASLFSNYLNALDSVKNGVRPLLITPTTYTEFADDIAVNANPAGGSQTITLPSAAALVGTERYISNIQTTGTNTVTIAAASGEFIDVASTLVCPNATVCRLKAILGSTKGTSTADSVSGAHWEQFGFSGGGAVSGNATSLQGFAIDPTAPTTGTPVLAYNGTSYIPSAVSGTVVPTATTSVLGIVKPDGTTITISGGTISAAGGGAVSSVFTRTGAVVATTGDYTVAQVTGAAPLASPTFTGTTVASGTALNITATNIQRNGGSAHLSNGCNPTALAAGATTATCTITGGATGDPCTWAATNQLAQNLINNTTTAAAITASGNVPRLSISGSTATLTFLTGGVGTFINTPVSGETFTVLCEI